MSSARSSLMQEIQRHLTGWIDRIRLHNAKGLTDINTDAKNVCCGLLNIMLDAQFQNLNLLIKNHPVIDLADKEQHICVKIISKWDSSKISSTLERFFHYNFDREYDRLIILVLDEKKNYRKSFSVKEGFSFEPARDIWDIHKLLSLAEQCDLEKLHQVNTYLQEQLGNPGGGASAMQNRSALLDRVQHILKKYADTIQASRSPRLADILKEAESLFCTLLNMAYDFKLVAVNQYAPNPTAMDLIDQDNGIAVQITDSNTRLRAQKTSDLFLKQGLNETCNTLLILILVYEPPFQNADSLFTQMKDEGVELQIKTLWDLARDIGDLPLELLSEITALLDENIGTTASEKQSDDTSVPMPSVKIDDLSDVLRQTFRLTTLLPPDGLERTVLEHGLTLAQKHALVDLIRHGFLLKEGSVIRLHPAFQHNSLYAPAPDECRFLLEQLWHFEESYRWDRFTLRAKNRVTNSLAQLFARASGLFPDSPRYAQHSAELWRDTQHYTDALALGQQALTGFRAIQNKSWDVARALHFTGECHIELNQPKLALADWEQTLQLCRSPLRASAVDLAAAYQNVGIALLELKEYQASKAYLLRSLKIMEALREESRDFFTPPWMAELYNSLSEVCTALSEVQDALLCQRNALLLPGNQISLWKDLVPLPPMPPLAAASGFAGRDPELLEIEKRFEQDDQPVYLSGLGGIGKTELTLRFGSGYKRGMVYFVPFRESFFNTIATEIGTYIDQYTIRSQKEQYQLAMDRLAQCSDDDILIIDNVDSVSGTLEDLMAEEAYRQLSALKLRLLLTTRFDTPRAVRIHPAASETQYEIFRKHRVFLEEAQMDALISAVNGHTLTIDLIAQTLANRRAPVSAAEMLDALNDPVLDGADFAEAGTDHPESTAQLHICQQLRKVFKAAHIPEIEQDILRFATLLPESGMDVRCFRGALTAEQQKACPALGRRGWITAEDTILTIHPLIRLVCMKELQPSSENCKTFLDTLWAQCDIETYGQKIFTQVAELFTNAVDILEDQDGNLLNRSGQLLLDLAKFRKVKELYEGHIPRLERQNTAHPALAVAYSNLGSACGGLGDYRQELEYQQRALDICKKVLPPDHPDLAVFYSLTSRTFRKLGNLPQALEYQLKALEIREKVLPPDHPDLAGSYIEMGIICGAQGDYQKGLEYQLKALAIREAALPPDHPDLAEVYTSVGLAHRSQSNLRNALEYLQKALDIRYRTLPPDHPALADAYNNIGSVYREFGDLRVALEYTRKALTIREKSLPPDHPDLARTYTNMGTAYQDLGNAHTATKYFLKALAICEAVYPPDHPNLAKAHRYVGIAYSGQHEYREAMEHLRKALNIQEKSLASNHPELARTYRNIATIYHGMEQYRDAAQYMRRAADIIDRSPLAADHPDRVRFRKLADWMEKAAKSGMQ